MVPCVEAFAVIQHDSNGKAKHQKIQIASSLDEPQLSIVTFDLSQRLSMALAFKEVCAKHHLFLCSRMDFEKSKFQSVKKAAEPAEPVEPFVVLMSRNYSPRNRLELNAQDDSGSWRAMFEYRRRP
jgi:hypothetical protein